jgi:hypothetical protein
MKIQYLVIAASAALAAAQSGACADIPGTPSQEGKGAVHGAVRENRLFRLTATEAARMRGAFRLADGRTLTITARRGRLYAELDAKIEELVPVAANTFVGRDSASRIVFNRMDFADDVVVRPAAP